MPENGPSGFVQDGELCFEIINFYQDIARVKRTSESIIRDIKTLTAKLVEELEKYNDSLRWSTRQRLKDRKKKLNDIVQVLGVPLKKSRPPAIIPAQLTQGTEMGSQKTYDVFLSYASNDSKEASQIYDFIADAGATAFLSEKSLKPGDDFEETIREAL
ncbi:MAG: hypothetical protein DMF69_15245, partial [Acidobacteria bacterium]